MKYIQSALKVMAVAALLTNAPAFAQEAATSQETHKKNHGQNFTELSERLSLNTDQQAKVKEIMIASRTKAKAIRESTPSKEDRRPKMKELMLDTDSRINAVLDSRQQALYKEYKSEKKAAMKNRKKD